MLLSEFKSHLDGLNAIKFRLPNGNLVPSHFHVTEMGVITKSFVDCGGTIREEKVVNFQLWVADDLSHKLEPKKLIGIIQKSESIFAINNLEVEVEYQLDTISKFGLDFNGEFFLLTAKQTDCLAKDNCGVPVGSALTNSNFLEPTCKPGSGCC